MTRTKHVFRQDVPCLRYAALGDTAVRVLAIHHLITRHDLDAVVVPQPNPELIGLWEAVLGCERVVRDPLHIPAAYRYARVSAPTELDWHYGAAAWNVFESVMWENGFFDTVRMRIAPPVVFPCNFSARAVMIYPNEGTDGNRVCDSDWWIEACTVLRARGYAINCMAPRVRHAPLRAFYEHVSFDRQFEPTLASLRACVAASSLALGASTGPTWTLLFSDIPQIVVESRRSPHGYWFFERCQPVLSKKLHVLSTLGSQVDHCGGRALGL